MHAGVGLPDRQWSHVCGSRDALLGGGHGSGPLRPTDNRSMSLLQNKAVFTRPRNRILLHIQCTLPYHFSLRNPLGSRQQEFLFENNPSYKF